MPSGGNPATGFDDENGGLPEPGKRWGSGAQSVLPYLTKSLQAKPASAVVEEPAPDKEGRSVSTQALQQAPAAPAPAAGGSAAAAPAPAVPAPAVPAEAPKQ